jgi:hypothetical protein
MKDNIMTLNMELFAFVAWLGRNQHVQNIDGLTVNDGYEWYNYMWNIWLKNTDAGKIILNSTGGEITWRGGNPDMDKTMDENKTTVTTPKNPNRASLETMEFKFYQESNCVDGGESEELIVEAKSSLGIDGDGGAFYVLKTKQWAVDGVNEISEILKRVERAVEATNPTSVH